jgi:N-acetylglucosaminyldiphosphoundecaprenol N-acetyl-beta-D-mannosaminyltransferase
MSILNTKYDNLTVAQALEKITGKLKESRKFDVFFLNADCLYKAQADEEYRRILNCADFVLPDGIGLKIATTILGGKMKDNCNGTDLSPIIMERAAQAGYRMFFLGGKDNVAEKAADNMRQRISNIKIVGTYTGYFEDDQKVIGQINASGADILFVSMGVPLQEKWIHRNRERLNPKLCLGVGALMDYLSGTIPRAPLSMRKIHLEWLWRIFIDPRRMFKRYIIHGLGFIAYLCYLRLCKYPLGKL